MGEEAKKTLKRRSLSNPVPWKEMFRAVSMSESRMPVMEGTANPSLRTAPATAETGKDTNVTGLCSRFGAQEALPTELVSRIQNWAIAAESKDKPSATPPAPLPVAKPAESPADQNKMSEILDSNRLKTMNFQLALYIAMAHAGLLLLIVTLYSLGLLLKDFWKPIQWAVLCSITMREIQGSLVRFWKYPLQQGLVQTLLAIPLAVCKCLVGTFHDAHSALLWISGKSQDGPLKVGFSKLLQWLVTFALLTLGYDTLGPHSLVTAIFTGLIGYAGLSSLGFFDQDESSISATGSAPKRSGRRSVTGKYLGWAAWPMVRIFRMLNRHSTRYVAARLRTIVAIGLIVLMILGSIAGLMMFSYKVGLEAKDAVVAVKDHVQQNNYTEMIGLRQWLENNNIPALIEQHASTAYETVSQQIDLFGIQYNLTEFTNAGKDYIIKLARGKSDQLSSAGTNSVVGSSHPVVLRLQNARGMLQEYDFKGIYSELEAAFFMLLDHFQLKPEDVREKVKQMSETGADIGKRVFVGGTVILSGGTSIMLATVSSIASGAAGIFNFLTQAVVFFSLLYYLITSQSGGVMEQVLSMVPLSNPTRIRCATVLNHAVSSVLLATVKSAFYQAAFTWLLFRFFGIHFLYVSTVLAITTAVLPVLPHWLASLPAVVQLALQGDYIRALVLTVVHFVVIDFGNRAIQDEIPGHNAYLAGLSIAGGMALFSPALEGAIMGPLLMTVLIALKNLYSEFVLNSEKNG